MTGVSDLPSQPVIILENLVKFFGRFAALRGISASFAPGRLYVILGDNGAGKSTLLRIVTGLMQPSQGKVTLLGAEQHSRRRAACGIHGPRSPALRRAERHGEPALLRRTVRPP